MMHIGVDAGGTLIKIACQRNRHGTLQLLKHPVAELKQVADWLNRLGDAKIYLTGGKSAQLSACLSKPSHQVLEFEAMHLGVRHLLADRSMPEDSFIVTNVGTGTSIHRVRGDVHQRIGGSGVGGGTILGLSRLLTGLTDYADIVRMAAAGTRDLIDLQVKHIYEGSEPPIPGNLTASNFGRLSPNVRKGEVGTPDLLAAVIGLVGETVATLSVLGSEQSRVPSILFIGSPFIGNSLLRSIVLSYTELRGSSGAILDNGEYCGAIGAMLLGSSRE